MSKGFLPVPRDFLDSQEWLGEKFTKGQAMLDLMGLVSFQPARVFIGSKYVELPKGSLYTSYYELSERWHWGRNKTTTFIKELAKAGFLTIRSAKPGAKQGTIITIDISTKNGVRYTTYEATDEASGKATNKASHKLSSIIGESKNKERDTAREARRPPGVPEDWVEAK